MKTNEEKRIYHLSQKIIKLFKKKKDITYVIESRDDAQKVYDLINDEFKKKFYFNSKFFSIFLIQYISLFYVTP